MNKYLEKIAARLKGMDVVRKSNDIYTIASAKRRKKTIKPSSKASRRFNRGPVRKGN